MKMAMLSDHKFTASEQQRILNESRRSGGKIILNQSYRNNSLINASILSANRIGEQHDSKIHHEDDADLQNLDDLNSDDNEV